MMTYIFCGRIELFILRLCRRRGSPAELVSLIESGDYEALLAEDSDEHGQGHEHHCGCGCSLG
nr:hypothetical protein [Neisseria sp. KH1003-01]